MRSRSDQSPRLASIQRDGAIYVIGKRAVDKFLPEAASFYINRVVDIVSIKNGINDAVMVVVPVGIQLPVKVQADFTIDVSAIAGGGAQSHGILIQIQPGIGHKLRVQPAWNIVVDPVRQNGIGP